MGAEAAVYLSVMPRGRMKLPDGWKGEVVDLSAVGLRVQSVALLNRGTVLTGTLVLPGGSRLVLNGRVIWSRPPDHANHAPAEIGIELVEPPELYLRSLAELFAEE